MGFWNIIVHGKMECKYAFEDFLLRASLCMHGFGKE
jgi:hypothetical protein